MPYAPTDRFKLTPAGEAFLDAREAPAGPAEDCRAVLAEHEPPCGRCPACRALYCLDDDDGREPGDADDGRRDDARDPW